MLVQLWEKHVITYLQTVGGNTIGRSFLMNDVKLVWAPHSPLTVRANRTLQLIPMT